MDELNFIKDDEILDYRMALLKLSHENIINLDEHKQFFSVYSPDLEIDPSHLCTNLDAFNSINNNKNNNNTRRTYNFNVILYELEHNSSIEFFVSSNETPNTIIKKYFKEKLGKELRNLGQDELDYILSDYDNLYALNVCGSLEVLYGDDRPIGNYKVNFFIIFV